MKWTKDIQPVDNQDIIRKVQARLDDLTKPPGSLGRMEDMVMQYCLCRGLPDAGIQSTKMYVFAGDHGITQSGVAAWPAEVTAQMVGNICRGGAAVSALSRNAGVKYAVVDMGVNAELEEHFFLIDKKVARGTKNFHREPAMSNDECTRAIDTGYELAREGVVDLVGVGEMGIGNSSSAAALYSLILGADPEQTVGAGAGAHGDLLAHKKKVIAEAVNFHRNDWDGTPLGALRRVGGFEIAGMTGMILGFAQLRTPVVVDGFISSAAALVAMQMCPHVVQYIYFSHISAEPFHRKFFHDNGLMPILDLGMRLGEGTGSVLAMQIIQQAMNCYHQMATFSSARVSNRE